MTSRREQYALLETSLLSTERQGKEQTQELSSLRDELVRKQDDQEALLAAGQKQLDALRQTGANDAVRMASLEGQIRQMSQLLGEKDVSLGEQQRLIAKQQEFLDSDRDIRELIDEMKHLPKKSSRDASSALPKPKRVFYTKFKCSVIVQSATTRLTTDQTVSALKQALAQATDK